MTLVFKDSKTTLFVWQDVQSVPRVGDWVQNAGQEYRVRMVIYKGRSSADIIVESTR